MKRLADHIMDIVQNSVRASSTLIEIIVTENCDTHLYTITIRDNGLGMTQEVAARALDPFFTSRTTRKVGLGLPLLKQNAEQSGGSVELVSQPGKGTTVTARFGLHHLDRPATGDVADVFILSVIANPGITISYSHTTDEGVFVLRSSDLINEIGFDSLKFKEIRNGVKEMIRNNLDLIKATE